MTESQGQLRLIELPSGEQIWARVTTDSRAGGDTGFTDRAAEAVESVRETIQGVVRSVAGAVEAHRPTETKVEFGLEFTAKSGKVFAALGELGATTSVKVTLTWKHDDTPDVPDTVAPDTVVPDTDAPDTDE